MYYLCLPMATYFIDGVNYGCEFLRPVVIHSSSAYDHELLSGGISEELEEVLCINEWDEESVSISFHRHSTSGEPLDFVTYNPKFLITPPPGWHISRERILCDHGVEDSLVYDDHYLNPYTEEARKSLYFFMTVLA